MKSKSEKVVVRMAPSPTGNFHVGSARTALFNFLFARKNNGKFILRIEDTDRERNKKEFEDDIFESLEWLGLKYDEFYRQSERGGVYKNYIEKMLNQGLAYESDDKVIRFRNPNKKVKFNDLVRGEIEFDTTELKDFVIAKSVDEPLYHLAVVIDDFESNITHVIRGEDHISNTPRQILIQEAISAPRPLYAHLPLILAQDRSKLSKRKHGESVSLDYYRSKGYSPEAIINYLALLGWNPGTEQEIFTLRELINVFDFSRVHKGGAIFDEKKLAWVNRKHFNLGKTKNK
ncbi:MAG: glutamate--tRNA ligase family protein [bacterium]|nr:glutamate--tRNA ligase family protein [bacterium]